MEEEQNRLVEEEHEPYLHSGHTLSTILGSLEGLPGGPEEVGPRHLEGSTPLLLSLTCSCDS